MNHNRNALYRSLLAAGLFAALCGPAWAQQEAPAANDPGVARAMFALAIADHEPSQVVTSLEPGAKNVYFFSEVRGMEGRTVRHRWEWNGQVMAEVSFQVRASRWRVYSSKQLLPIWGGTWKVSVVDEHGQAMHTETLSYGLAQQAPSPNTPTPAAPSDD